MVIGTNTGSINATFYLNLSNLSADKATKRLASSSRLADASDDAAGVAVSAKLDAVVRRLASAAEGAQNLISFSQTSDGFLGTVQNQLTRLGELAIRATDGTLSAADRANLNTEFVKVRDNITNQIDSAKFNGTPVFDPSQVVSSVVDAGGSNIYTLNIADARSNVSAVTASTINTAADAQTAIIALNTAIENITGSRAKVNSDVSALNQYIQNIGAEKVNTAQTNSRIRDADFAEETTNLAKFRILGRSATALLAQSNLSKQSVLGLLR